MSRGSPVARRIAVPDYATVAETAIPPGRGQSTIRAWIRDGRLPARRDHGGGVLVPLAELRATPPVVKDADADRH